MVFVVQMMDGYFPHSKSTEDSIDEERRLAYVAFTRAMKRLIVSRSKFAGAPGTQPQPVPPSRFLFGIPLEVCDGTPPTGDGDIEEEPEHCLPQHHRPKLQALSKQRAAALNALTPTGGYTLVDIESTDQLRRDRLVHHYEHGFGRVRRHRDHQIEVEFRQGVVRLMLGGTDLQLVDDESVR